MAFWGFFTIVVLLLLIMSKKVSAIIALIAVPLVMAFLAGIRSELFAFMMTGLKDIAPTAVMFIFAILFFGILMDAGTFRPVIRSLLKLAGNDPLKIVLATVVLAMVVHLDGSGAVTFIITIPAFLPLYDELGMRRSTLATMAALAAGTMNMVPWGGPTIRAASALDLDIAELFHPMLIPLLGGLLTVFGIAVWLGLRERKRLAWNPRSGTSFQPVVMEEADSVPAWKLGINWLMIIGAVTALISGAIPPAIVFILAFIVALQLNFPSLTAQKARVDAHAKEAMLMAGILFAAGCFTGILSESGMMAAMGNAAVEVIPESIGRHMALWTGVASMPASLLFDPDSFYFGILPLLADAGAHFGVNAEELGRAAITGQMTTGFPVSPLTGSTFLLVGLTGVELGEHQRRTIPLAFLVSIIMLMIAGLTSAIHF